MAKDDETRHKSKRHKIDREKERDEHTDQDRDGKRSRSEKASQSRAQMDDNRSLKSPNGSDRASIRPEAEREGGDKAEEANGEISMSIEETNR